MEQDFSFKSYFELFERMGDWSALSKVCEGQVDTKEDFWKDEWSLDTLLPHMMKATCRQVLNGSDECQEFLKVHYICHHLGRFFFCYYAFPNRQSSNGSAVRKKQII